MVYKFEDLRDEYNRLWESMRYKTSADRAAEKVALRLLSNLPRYMTLQQLTSTPAAFIMVSHERESSGNFGTYLGNGQPLTMRTTIAPVGRGPFSTFEAGAVDALVTLKGLDKIGLGNWDEARLCFYLETFNGFGYRMNGIRSPYLWGGTNHQQVGKYTSDGKLDRTVMDTQLGGMAIYGQIVKLRPELDIGGPAAPVAPKPWEDKERLRHLQLVMNELGADPALATDGVIGPRSKDAFKDLGAKIGV